MSAGKVRWIAIFIVLAVVAVVCLSGIYVVNQGEKAVVLTFGKITDTKDAGTYWRMPFIQQINKQSTMQKYTVEYGYRTTSSGTTTSAAQYEDRPEESIMLTSDQNIVSVEAVFYYTVSDVSAYFYEVDDQEGTMRCAFEAVIRRNLQNRTLDEALLAKQEIADQVLPDFIEMLRPYKLGVAVSAVQIQNIDVPKEVNAAYIDVNNALTEKTKNLDEAEKYKNQVVPNAEAQAYKLVQEAQAYSAKIIANAKGEVAEFNAVYEKYKLNKEITRKRLLIETLESILSNANKLYIMNDDGGLLKMLNIDNSPLQDVQPAATEAAQTGGN